MFLCCSQEPEAPKQEIDASISVVEVAQQMTLEPAAGNLVLSMDRTEGAALGMLLDTTDPKNLAIIKVSDGLLQIAAEASKKVVKAGFRIVKVNGRSAAAREMVAMVQERKPLEIEFETFEEKIIKVEKDDKKLGVILDAGQDGRWATISKIEAEGFIADWNAAAAPEQRVMVSDKIVAIDGQEARSAEEMVRWIKEKPTMELTIYSWKSLQS
eukprot:TRINITY_DN8333_c0_g3_i1.p1 TRINITY_DN8333_c0_g3~~TRINITY_DN8333_c0_g3_i1.p1  ORF type:complete len:213 (+),score=60.52 TRINITY_DN8333_c0_g3_i1:97-735(+)